MAAESIYNAKRFTPEMLTSEPIRQLINETYSTLSEPVKKSFNISELAQKKDSKSQKKSKEQLLQELLDAAYNFSGFKVFHQMNEVGFSLKADDEGIISHEKFKEKIKSIDANYNETYLNTEYQLFAGSTRMADKWDDYKQDGDRYDLQYRTAEDDRVREEHARLDRITLPQSDPFWEKYFPPNGYNCRCTTIQVRKGKYPSSNSKDARSLGDSMTTGKASIFRWNPGISKTQYPQKHPYMPSKTDCTNCDKGLKLKLYYDATNLACQACRQIELCKNLKTEKVATTKSGNAVYTYSSEKKKDDYADRLRCVSQIAEIKNKDSWLMPEIEKDTPLYKEIYGDLIDTIYENKCPDSKVGKEYYEYKGHLPNPSRPYRTFGKCLSRGCKQSDKIIILDCGLSRGRMLEAINGKINAHKLITEVWIDDGFTVNRLY
jgi:SPP1 gp7 family putative phage head morphogenesis protein